MSDWYATVGQAHLREFFGLINRTIRHGKINGLQVKRIDMTDMLRIYRGENTTIDKRERKYTMNSKVTLETIKEIQELYWQGVQPNDLAERFGLSRSYIINIINKRSRRHVV